MLLDLYPNRFYTSNSLLRYDKVLSIKLCNFKLISEENKTYINKRISSTTLVPNDVDVN